MKIHYILHADFEKLGLIENWAIKNNYQLTGTNLHKGEVLADLNKDEFDMVISMGGPQNLSEIEKYPELEKELQFMKECIERNKMILGICLGAQMISLALGGKMKKCQEKEIGCFPVQSTSYGRTDKIFSQFPNVFDAIHWHGEMAVPPASCNIIASTSICEAQVFSYKDRTYGIQFHLEFTPDSMENMILNAKDDIPNNGNYVQSTEQLRAINYTKMNQHLFIVLNYYKNLYDSK